MKKKKNSDPLAAVYGERKNIYLTFYDSTRTKTTIKFKSEKNLNNYLNQFNIQESDVIEITDKAPKTDHLYSGSLIKSVIGEANQHNDFINIL